MSNTSIQLKKSGQTGNTPSNLEYGEVAINYADGKLYYKNASNGISYIRNQTTFDTLNVNNSLILATSESDTLSIVTGNNISLGANTSTKTISIGTTEDISANTVSVNSHIAFSTGEIQTNRATKVVTNTDWVGGLQINSLVPGDIYYDDTSNKLFVWTNFGSYYDFYDITPPA
jgi:hypothetical protein